MNVLYVLCTNVILSVANIERRTTRLWNKHFFDIGNENLNTFSKGKTSKIVFRSNCGSWNFLKTFNEYSQEFFDSNKKLHFDYLFIEKPKSCTTPKKQIITQTAEVHKPHEKFNSLNFFPGNDDYLHETLWLCFYQIETIF